jgi:hypothetical protein
MMNSYDANLGFVAGHQKPRSLELRHVRCRRLPFALARGEGTPARCDSANAVRPRRSVGSIARCGRSLSSAVPALLLLACHSPTSRPLHEPTRPVTVTAERTTIVGIDSVTFTATIRPDLAILLNGSQSSADPDAVSPHVVGWLWVPDLVGADPWTKACAAPALTCRAELHGSGTMVFSVRLVDEVCADWVHIDAEPAPDIDERDASARKRRDSVEKSLRTTSPTWERCSK